MRRHIDKFRMVLPSLATVLVLTALAHAASRTLSEAELNTRRGSNGSNKKCSESCNRWNNFHNLCLNQPNGATCLTCEHAGNLTYYVDPDGTSPPCEKTVKGFQVDTKATSTDCGLQKSGYCKDQSCTESLKNTIESCKNREVVVEQTGLGDP